MRAASRARAERRRHAPLYAGLAAAKGAAVLQLLVLARYLSPLEFGQLALATAWAAAFGALLDFRAFETIIVFVQRQRGRGDSEIATWSLRRCFAVDGGSGVLAFLVVAATAPWVAGWLLDDSALGGTIILAGAGTLFATLDTSALASLRVLDDLRRIAISDGVLEPVRRALVIAVVLSGGSVVAALAAAAVGQVLTSGWLVLTSVRRLRTAGWLGGDERAPSLDERRRMRRFLLGTNVFGSLKVVSAKIDQLLVGVLLAPADAGSLRLALGAIDLHNALVGPLITVSYPEVVEADDHGDEEVKRLGRTLSKRATFVAVAGAAVLLVGSATVTTVFALPFDEAELVGLVAVLLVGSVLSISVFWAGYALMARGRVGLLNLVTVLRLLVQVAIAMLLIRPVGVIGGAVAASVGLAFGPVACFALFRSGKVSRRSSSAADAEAAIVV